MRNDHEAAVVDLIKVTRRMFGRHVVGLEANPVFQVADFVAVAVDQLETHAAVVPGQQNVLALWAETHVVNFGFQEVLLELVLSSISKPRFEYLRRVRGSMNSK